MINILVTGAGALLGQGILRCLNFSNHDYNIITADPDVRSTGHALANKCYKIPFATDKIYLKRIEEIIEAENINIIFIGTDVELLIFAEKKTYLEQRYKLQVVVSDVNVIEIANDKWLTSEFLRKNGFPYPISALATDREKITDLKNTSEYPFIAKPIDGARSRGIEIINDETDLNRVCSYPNNLVVQEMIGDDGGEFTTGCIVLNGKCVAIVSLTRDLRDGNTWRAYRDDNSSKYDQIICNVAEKLGVNGPVNFQYRIKDDEPIIFEINGRFSGTTPLRLMFGFNEVEAIIDYYFNNKEINQPVLRNGLVLRTFSDLFINHDTLKQFDKAGFTNSYSAKYYPFKKDI